MSRVSGRQLAGAVAGMGLLILSSACSQEVAEFPGLSEAALSCSQSLDPATINSQIVPIGISIRLAEDTTPDELPALVTSAQERAIVAARAASLNDYWQPLADAWSIHEALLRYVQANPAVEQTESDPTIETPSVEATADSAFLRNVNVDFAAITKDTYCRIAFSKAEIPIVYSPNE